VIETVISPYAAQAAQLDEVTGIGATCAQELIAELGVDMIVFPTAAHLASWARFAPRANQSAGKTKPATTGKGNPWLASTLGRPRTRQQPQGQGDGSGSAAIDPLAAPQAPPLTTHRSFRCCIEVPGCR
jgi:hypothetical protein